MTALLGFRPALAAPGRSASFAGACLLVCMRQPACLLSQLLPLSLLNLTLPPTTFAVCQPLRKPAVRRQAAADPSAPLPPPPAGSGHDGVPPQPAPRGKRWYNTLPRVPAVQLQPWKQNFLVCCGIVLLGAAENIWTGPPIAIVAGVMAVIAVLLLLALL